MTVNTIDTNAKETSWPAPAALKSGLYVVATPIGNLRDITLRALDVLKAADLIACEDTRVSRKLLSAYEIGGKLMSYNDFSDDEKRGAITAAIASGQAVALISDAGSPLVSDPGYRLVQDCYDLGLMVTVIPGASSVIAALQLSGLPSDHFTFIGFLPAKSKARQDCLLGWRDHPATIIAFETAPRLVDSLNDIARIFGNRQIAVIREISKLFEQVRRGLLYDMAAHYAKEGPPKGEIVLVISGAEQTSFTDDALGDMIRQALKSMSLKDAAAHVTAISGLPKSKIYNMALVLSKK